MFISVYVSNDKWGTINTMKLVLAGNYQQFMRYCEINKKIPNKDAVYIDCPEKLMGREIKEEDMVYFGSHYRHTNYDNIVRTLQERMKR